MLEEYRYKENKKLRCGYTTGSCGAAAAKAAAKMLLTGKRLLNIELMTPKGILLSLGVEDIKQGEDKVSCGIRKDSGDDADITNGIFVYAWVSKIPKGIIIDGGCGIGRVTRSGLEQEIGQAAINSVPRRMITEAVESIMEETGYEGGLEIIISIPGGEEIAVKTFNPRLGIEGGISILGTSGIVEPMSESALVETIRTEIKMLVSEGQRDIIITPGNYGSDFIKKELGIDLEYCVKCSNFIGNVIDMAFEFRLRSILLVGHMGKLVKLGSGVMNTHSKWADCRMETLASCVLLAGGEAELGRRVLSCNTTDEAVELLSASGNLSQVMEVLMKKAAYHLNSRAYHGLEIGVITFSNKFGVLGKTSNAEVLLNQFR